MPSRGEGRRHAGGCGYGRRRRPWHPDARFGHVVFQGAEQGLGVDGLGDVVVHAGSQGLFPVPGHGVGGHGDDGQGLKPGVLAEAPGGLVAVHDRHLHVHEHRVESARDHGIHRLLAVGGHGDRDPHGGQDLAGHLPVDVVVLHQQDAGPGQGGPGPGLGVGESLGSLGPAGRPPGQRPA